MRVPAALGPIHGRGYFAFQSAAGLLWWAAVAVSAPVRETTLGGLDPIPIAWADIPLFVVASALVGAGLRSAVWVVVPWTGLVALAMAGYATATREAGWGALLMAAAFAGSAAAALLVLRGRLPTEWICIGPFAFRSATATGIRVLALRTGGQIVVFWGLFLVVLPLLIAWVELRWRLALPPLPGAGIAGVALLLAASALGVWSAVAMTARGAGTPLPSAMANRLVVSGPYRVVRNPMAVAGIAQGVGVGLILGSWLVVAYALCGSLVWNRLVRPLEEADLEARFGDAFRAYRDRVPCWMPRLPRPGG